MKTATFNESRLHTLTHRVAETAQSTWASVKHASRTFVHSTQVARMTEALYSMTDEQLDQIGVTRKDIPKHVQKIMAYEYDGL